MLPITLKRDEKLSLQQAREIFQDASADEQRLYIESVGPWSIISKCVGLVVHTNFDTGEKTIYGYRTLSRPKQSGYELEGYVSIAGKRYSAFTSSQLFELENGHLINVGVIHPRIR